MLQAKPAHADSEIGKALTRDQRAQIGGRLNAKQLQAVKVQGSLDRLAVRDPSGTVVKVINREDQRRNEGGCLDIKMKV